MNGFILRISFVMHWLLFFFIFDFCFLNEDFLFYWLFNFLLLIIDFFIWFFLMKLLLNRLRSLLSFCSILLSQTSLRRQILCWVWNWGLWYFGVKSLWFFNVTFNDDFRRTNPFVHLLRKFFFEKWDLLKGLKHFFNLIAVLHSILHSF